ncbi:hypothetical protein Salat_1214900 [Sesamum alatum]|uniref:Uncharacterized protein n=1 Tax=Sesamum alatum TaxID=300844 RepID=A0AAE1YFP8_9LAMI|nr:hypothetical protein Salat_1214900 [Sesamum alatum]
MVTRARARGRGTSLHIRDENEELLGVESSHVAQHEQKTSSNTLPRAPDLHTEVDETIPLEGNNPIIGEASDDMRYRWNDLTDMQMRKVWNENASSRLREMIYRAKQNALENASKELGRELRALDMIGRGPDWMHTHIWDELVEKHRSGENYKGKCITAQKNRMIEKEGCITKHTDGSIPQGAHKMRMEKELGCEVSELELFHRTHRRNHGTGDCIDNKSKKVNEDYMAEIGGNYESTESSFDMQSSCEVTGGPCKGRIYGFGRSQSSDRFSRISITSTLRESEERYNELTKAMDEKYNELTMKMQEELLRQEAESKKMLEQALEDSGPRHDKHNDFSDQRDDITSVAQGHGSLHRD